MKREIIYLSLHSHHQNDSCIKMGSDESHVNGSLIMRDSQKTASTTTTFEEKGEPKWIRTVVLLLTSLTLTLTARPNRLTPERYWHGPTYTPWILTGTEIPGCWGAERGGQVGGRRGGGAGGGVSASGSRFTVNKRNHFKYA